MTGDRRFVDAASAVECVEQGSIVVLGGWGVTGSPDVLIAALAERGVGDLTVIMAGCLAAEPLNERGLVRRLISSFASYPGAMGRDRAVDRQVRAGHLEVELCPQGILAERLRAGGAGIPAFYVDESVIGTLGEGKPTMDIGGRRCVLQTALRADVALVDASVSDRRGNLSWRAGERNYNEVAAWSADRVLAQTQEIYEVGWLAPEHVMFPGLAVHALVDAST